MNDQRYITTEVKTIIAETLRVRMPVFRQLRNQQTNLVVILSEKYQELDKIQAKPEEETNVSQLYSDDGKQQYLKLLEKKIAIVRQLADISSNRRWPQLLSYYQTLSHNLNNSNFTETICEENAIESKEKYATKSEKKGKEKITKSVKEKQPTQSANQLLKKQELSPFQKLKQTYEHLQKNTKNIVLLVELIEKLQVIDPKELGFEQLEIFQVIQKQTLDSGVKCFERALLMGNFIEARQLIQFFDESQYKWKGHALATKNTMLVKFLVNELDFPLENYSITVGKKDYFNVYEYCYENAKQNHEMAELFEFFLSIDFLSICRSINGSLPIAHRILTEKPNSPLLNILEKKS